MAEMKSEETSKRVFDHERPMPNSYRDEFIHSVYKVK